MASMSEEFRVALETERKFEFYFTAAIFTIFGLAVQTVEVYPDRARDVLLLGGYFFLAISAACAAIALSRFIQRNWVVAELEDMEANLYALRSERRRPAIPSHHAIGMDEEREVAHLVSNLGKEQAEANNLKNLIRYTRELRNWSFVLGLVLLLISRIWPVFAAIMSAPGPTGAG